MRSPTEATTQPNLINKTPRQAMTDAATSRAVPTRPATVASDFSVQAPRSSYPASPGRPYERLAPVLFEAHAGNTGTEAENLELTRQRAENARVGMSLVFK